MLSRKSVVKVLGSEAVDQIINIMVHLDLIDLERLILMSELEIAYRQDKVIDSHDID